MPSSCANLNNNNLGYSNRYNLDSCINQLGYYPDLPAPIRACLPQFANIPVTTPGTFYYNCLVSAGIACNYDSICTTATYTVGNVPTPTPTVYTDVIANTGFETGDTSGWLKTYSNQYQWTESFAPGFNSDKSYKATFLNTNGALLYLKQDVMVVPGAQYKISMATKHENPLARCDATFEFYPPTYNPGSVATASFFGRAANVWVTSEATFTAPRSFGFVQLRFYCNVDKVNTMYFDNLSFKRV